MRAFTVVAGLWFALVTTTAHADDRFHWALGAGAEQCPSVNAIRTAADSMIGSPLEEVLAASHVRVEGSVEAAAPGHWAVVLRVQNEAGEQIGARTLDAAFQSCRSIRTHVALVLSLLMSTVDHLSLDATNTRDEDAPAVAATPAAASPRPETRAPETRAPAPVPRALHAPAPVFERSSAWRLVLAVGPSTGIVPSTTVQASVGAELRVGPSLFVGARAQGWSPSSTFGAMGGVRLAAVSLCAMVGGELELGPFALALVLGAHVAAVHASGVNVLAPEASTRPLFAPFVGVRISTRLYGMATVFLSAETLFPMPRDHYYYGGDVTPLVELFRTELWSAQAELGVSVPIL